MRLTFAALCLLTVTGTQANELSIRLSDDALAVYLDPVASETNSVQFSVHHNDDDDSTLLSAGLFANGERSGIEGRLGGKAYYGDIDSDSGYGIALGGDFSYTLSEALTLNAGAFVGPGVLSFSDVDAYQEWFVRVNYRLFDTARLGVGYSTIELEPERGPDVELEDGVFVEMNLRF